MRSQGLEIEMRLDTNAVTRSSGGIMMGELEKNKGWRRRKLWGAGRAFVAERAGALEAY